MCVLDDGVSSAQRNAIEVTAARARVPVSFVDLRNALDADLPETGYLTRAAFGRLIAPQLRPDAHRVVYLDADVLVRGDIRELFELGLGSAVFAAAPDTGFPLIRNSMPWLDAGRFGEASRPYVNSGVLVIHCDRWRERDVAQRVISFVDEFSHRISYGDQDAINAVIGDEVEVLPHEWNYQVGAQAELRRQGVPRPATARPRAVHFVGVKPWLSLAAAKERGQHRFHAQWWGEHFRTGGTSLRSTGPLIRDAVRRAVR